ncbi:MAG: Crp/Fnr family transcriptional regulator [Candidatus Nomurabacteria bacterium]|nr:MAG: Crp/Fnr family transcriptional regulator [Candidatus Nomurabacteria bacterium]
MNIYENTQHIDEWHDFLKKCSAHKYKKGEIIFLKNENTKKICIIKSGIVKVYDIDNEGEEQQVALDTITEVFPIGVGLGIHKNTLYFYEAFTDVEVYILERKDFLEYIADNPRIGYEMYEGLAKRFVSMQTRVYALEQKKALDKIVLTLLYLCERFGTQLNSKSVKIELPLSHKELSNFIGLTRETISLTLKKLSDQSAISYKGKYYTIDTKKLKDIIDP